MVGVVQDTNNKCLTVLSIQELLYIIIENLTYNDFINLKLANQYIYNTARGYNDNYIFKKYINTLPYKNIDSMKIWKDNEEIHELRSMLKKANIPIETFRVHDYKIITTDKTSDMYPGDIEDLNDCENLRYFYFTFYYHGYHGLKFVSKSLFDKPRPGDCCNNYIDECNLYYNRFGFFDNVYDKYKTIKKRCLDGPTRKRINNFKYIQNYVFNMDTILELFKDFDLESIKEFIDAGIVKKAEKDINFMQEDLKNLLF